MRTRAATRTSVVLGLALVVALAVPTMSATVDGIRSEDFTALEPVVIAGGPKVSSEREVFDFVYDGIQNGAIGLNLGRNVWQHDHPVAMVKALRAIIHENASAKEAEDIFEDEKQRP